MQEAIRILRVVRAVGQAHSMSHVLDVFRGSNGRNVKKYKHDALSIHGIGKGVRQGSNPDKTLLLCVLYLALLRPAKALKKVCEGQILFGFARLWKKSLLLCNSLEKSSNKFRSVQPQLMARMRL